METPVLAINAATYEIALWKEGICNWPSDNTCMRLSDRPTIAPDSTGGDWALFMDTWG